MKSTPKKDKRPTKTPLDFVLEQVVTPEARDLVLKTTHALVSACFTKAMLDTAGKPAATIASEAKAYASQLHELEVLLGGNFSAVLPQQHRVVRTTPDRMPRTPAT